MPSGKQALISLLTQYSQEKTEQDDIDEVSNRVKSALCAHCSTSGESMKMISDLSWLSEESDGSVIRQGLGLIGSNTFLTDLYDEIISDDGLLDRLLSKNPNLSKDTISSGVRVIWYLLSSLQYWSELKEVESENSADDFNRMLDGYAKWLANYQKEPW